jgi:MSHA biogenesis protein MshE
MRDQETAQIGLRAALTGHLVFSTLHTRDAASTPLRLIDMGAPAYMVSTSLHAVLAQRLVRLICESCAESDDLSAQTRAWLDACHEHIPTDTRFMRGRGCSHCNGTGFRGRNGVYELLEMDGTLVDAVNRADPAAFMAVAQERLHGRTLRSHALALAAAGRTTIAEVMRVASEVED